MTPKLKEQCPLLLVGSWPKPDKVDSLLSNIKEEKKDHIDRQEQGKAQRQGQEALYSFGQGLFHGFVCLLFD